VQLITPAEAAELSDVVHLAMWEWLQHVTVVLVDDDWQSDEDGTSGLWRGGVLQVCRFREGGWAFGGLPQNSTGGHKAKMLEGITSGWA